MKEHKVTVVVVKNGRIVIDGVPVLEGQEVEVTFQVKETAPPTFPLRGQPVYYEDPFGPAVDESDWNALN
jgi:hypothetical protein